MPSRHKPRIGEIFWLDDCPPLDGQMVKRRPVVFLGSIRQTDPQSPLLVVAVSHTASQPERDPDMIRLPDLQQSPQVRTGLSRPSWAIPRWFAVIEPQRIDVPMGYLSGSLLKRLIAAVNRRVDQAERES